MHARRPPSRRLVDLLIVAGLVAAACSGPAGDVIASEESPEPTAVAAVDSSTIPPSSSAPTAPVVSVQGTDEPGTDEPGSSSTNASTAPSTSDSTTATTASTTTSTNPGSSSTAQPASVPAGGDGAPIRLRLDRRVSDAATDGFEDLVRAVLTDERGWTRAGFEISFITEEEAAADPGGAYTVVLAEGDEVDSLCLPYDTFGRFSCQIGPVVALNADRWRNAVESWPASLDEYRTMLVNHEVGHLLGQHHPAVRCPGDGQPAPVMAQQSSGVAPCTANPWPLDWEIVCARQGVEPLAPGFERDIELTCGPDGPIN